METTHGSEGNQPERKMELEVSKKIREAIKAKLLELGSHIDEELPDYVMILIANRRTVPQMETDLSLFLGDSAKKFVNWLTYVLKKLDRVTSVPGQKSEDDGAGTGSSSKSKSRKMSKSKKSSKEDKVGKSESKSPKKVTKHRRSKHAEPTVIDASSVVTSSTEDLRPRKSASPSKSSNSESSKRLRLKSVDKNEDHDVTKQADISKSEPSKENTSHLKIMMKQQSSRIKRPIKRSALDDEHEDDVKPRPRLTLLSDDEQPPAKTNKASNGTVGSPTEEAKISNHVDRISHLDDSQQADSSNKVVLDSQPENKVDSPANEPETHVDTLILNTEENEFADNVEELRRIALESQERKRRDRGAHQKKLITGILMSNKDSFKDKADRRMTRSSEHEKPKHSSKDSSPYRTSVGGRESKEPVFSRSARRDTKESRSPRQSVFNRLSKNSKRESSRDMKSRSRSRSPVRKLTSTIGNVINRSTSVEDVDVRPSVNSVVHVTDRPKRDLKMNNKLLMIAVQDAQKSIIQTEQRKPKANEKTRSRDKRSSLEKTDRNETYRSKEKSIKTRLQLRERTQDENVDKRDTVTSRRFHEFPEVDSEEFFEPTDAESRRKSIKERLGVRRERRPVKDRLGMVQNQDTPEEDASANREYNFHQDDFNIVINVNDKVEQRNVTLANTQADIDSKKLNRISIRVNDSEEEDSSDEDYDSSENEDGRAKDKSTCSGRKDSGSVDGDEVVCVINEDDKLPDPESDVEYILEEIEVEESSNASDGIQTENLEPETDTSPKENKISEKSGSATSIDSQLNKRLNTLRAQSNEISRETDTLGNLSTTTKPFPAGSSQCKFWPNCQFKDNCIYDHPKCKFNPCTNTQCVYKHVVPPVYKPLPENPSKKKVCKFYPKCTSMSCKFFHPSPCRFGVGCTSVGCQNYHPGVTIGMQNMRAKGKTVIPKVNELKWVKK